MSKSSFGHRPPRGKPQGKRFGSWQQKGGGGRGEKKTAGGGDHKSPSRQLYLLRRAKSQAKPEEAVQERDGKKRPFQKRPHGDDRKFRPQRADRTPSFEKGARPAAASGPVVSETMRISKAMSRAGLCSRRDAERWIADGRVSVNGTVLTSPAVDIKPKDRVLVDGRPLPVAEPAQLWRYNKAKGLVTTHSDPQGRPTVFDSLPPELPRVISVGRLDFNTEGLILLTNDGELARHLELPATGWLRRYRVRAKGRVTQEDLDRLKDGVEIEGVRYGPIEAAADTTQGANMWLTIGIREGKNREVRKVLAHLGLEVNRLIRISFGPFQLLDLLPGQAEAVPQRVLSEHLGSEVAGELGIAEPKEEKTGDRPRKPQHDRGHGKPSGQGKPHWKTRPREDDAGAKDGRKNDGGFRKPFKDRAHGKAHAPGKGQWTTRRRDEGDGERPDQRGGDRFRKPFKDRAHGKANAPGKGQWTTRRRDEGGGERADAKGGGGFHKPHKDRPHGRPSAPGKGPWKVLRRDDGDGRGGGREGGEARSGSHGAGRSRGPGGSGGAGGYRGSGGPGGSGGHRGSGGPGGFRGKGGRPKRPGGGGPRKGGRGDR